VYFHIPKTKYVKLPLRRIGCRLDLVIKTKLSNTLSAWGRRIGRGKRIGSIFFGGCLIGASGIRL